MTERQRVLVADDDPLIQRLVRTHLDCAGFRVLTAAEGEEALDVAVAEQPDLIVLDLMLPKLDGFEVCRRIREFSLVPVVMLTARGEQVDKLRGFEAGADDYLTKPFELAILIARLRGLLRRRDWLQASSGSQSPAKAKDAFIFGTDKEKEVDFNALELSVRGQVFRLTLMEANLLRYLIEHEGKPVSRKNMLQEVWGVSENADTRPIDNFIVRLRRYMEDHPTNPRHLQTVRGVGYRFVAANQPQ